MSGCVEQMIMQIFVMWAYNHEMEFIFYLTVVGVAIVADCIFLRDPIVFVCVTQSFNIELMGTEPQSSYVFSEFFLWDDG